MRTLRHLSIYLLALTFTLSACKKEEETPRGEYAQGIFIVNEGNFSDSDGTVSFFDPTEETVTQDIYQEANGTELTGVFQSVYFNDDYAYIIDQVGNKVEVVEAETFEYVATINEGLSTPRYMTVANGKGYITNWGPFDEFYDLPDSYIAVVDLSNFNVTNTINTDNGIEGITTVGNLVYAAASYSNVVHVIDPQADEITGGFTTPGGPKTFAEDNAGKLWVICNDYVTSSLARLDPSDEMVETTFTIAGGAKSLVSNGDGSQLYYLSAPWGAEAQIYTVTSTATFAPVEPIITGDSFYGLGVDPDDEVIYVAKSNGADNGTIIRYTSDGTEMDNFPAGRYPNSIAFRN